jgi:hypothetical protein
MAVILLILLLLTGCQVDQQAIVSDIDGPTMAGE